MSPLRASSSGKAGRASSGDGAKGDAACAGSSKLASGKSSKAGSGAKDGGGGGGGGGGGNDPGGKRKHKRKDKRTGSRSDSGTSNGRARSGSGGGGVDGTGGDDGSAAPTCTVELVVTNSSDAQGARQLLFRRLQSRTDPGSRAVLHHAAHAKHWMVRDAVEHFRNACLELVSQSLSEAQLCGREPPGDDINASKMLGWLGCALSSLRKKNSGDLLAAAPRMSQIVKLIDVWVGFSSFSPSLPSVGGCRCRVLGATRHYWALLDHVRGCTGRY
jgi:hypothetical protein